MSSPKDSGTRRNSIDVMGVDAKTAAVEKQKSSRHNSLDMMPMDEAAHAKEVEKMRAQLAAAQQTIQQLSGDAGKDVMPEAYAKVKKEPGAIITEELPPEFSYAGKTFPRVKITEIDERDANTPDSWVPRHPELVRLTGKHPFNCEPPLPLLCSYGWLSPVSLHYVRNHGAAVKRTWEEHKVAVEGVPSPTVLSMDEIVSMPSISRMVTLCCAGNRRKEQNMTAQTIGFSWGPTAHACSLWKGAPIRDVLIRCGVSPQGPWAGHLEMVGPEGELPKGAKGDYGTSVPLWYAMDPANDMMLAYEQNGALLQPDHGFPVRILIPGYIGGRMIKFVVRLAVIDNESDNFYHFNDNRILPPHVTAEIANAEGWWYKPEYIFNELNINSAITYPAHDEVVSLSRTSNYKMTGYAYTGKGNKVTRIELSFDGGSSWELATLIITEKPTPYGKYWCWVHWEYELDPLRLFDCEDIRLRAWDMCSNTQPAKLTWNVMGMGNNPHYRVKVHSCRLDTGDVGVWFEHPTQPGNVPGGWMVPKGPDTPAPDAVRKVTAIHVPQTPDTEAYSGPPKALHPAKRQPFKLIEREELSHDTRRFRFALQSPEHILGLPIGKHMMLAAKVDGKLVMRAYTPTTSDDEVGYFDLVIKVYFPNVHPKFPEGGKLTQWMEKMKIGDTIEAKGPIGHFTYLGQGKYKLDDEEKTCKRFSMLAGGSGITPMVQVMNAVLKDPEDKTELALIYANQSEDDILLRDMLDGLVAAHPTRLKVWYTVDRPPEGWKYGKGFINEDMVRTHLFEGGEESTAIMCGPPPMIKFACLPNLEKAGYPEDKCISF